MGTPTPIQALDSVTGNVVADVGDSTNSAIRVNVVAGGGGGGGTSTVVVSNTPTVIGGGGSFTANAGSGTFTTLATLSGNTNTVVANAGSGTFTTSISNTPTVVANAGSGTFTVSPASGLVSTNNSTTTILTANSVFTGTADDTTNYACVEVSVIANVASAAAGLNLEFSSDNVHWDIQTGYTITAGAAFSIQTACYARYFRVVYTNGGTDQAAFRLQSLLKPASVSPVLTAGANNYQAVPIQGTTAGIPVPVSAGSGTFTVGGTVTANAGSGTFTTSISNTPAVTLSGNTNTVVANAGSGTFTVGGTVTANAGSGTMTVSVSNTPAITLSGSTNTVVANAGSGTYTVSVSNTVNNSTSQKAASGAAVATGNTATATHAAATCSFGAIASTNHMLGGICWSYSAAPTGGNVSVVDNGNTVFTADITAAGPGFIPFTPPLQGTVNSTFTVTLADGGSGVVGRLNINKWDAT